MFTGLRPVVEKEVLTRKTLCETLATQSQLIKKKHDENRMDRKAQGPRKRELR